MKRVTRYLLLCLALGFFAAPARAVLDLNSDTIPDVWALVYGSGALSPAGDADGDGMSNAVEGAAGTDPFKPGSTIKVTAVTLDAGGLHLTFPTQAGKRYQVQSTPSLAPAVWTNAGAALAGTGGDVVATLSAAGATQNYYRVLVQDVDTDGDGVTDWEEIALGFDPNNSHSHGAGGADDLAAITAGLGSANTVSVTAGAAVVTEPPTNNVSTGVATFVVTRSGGFGKITVNYAASGSATAGADYSALSGSVMLGVGVNTATLTVTPLADALVESPEAVIVTIAAGTGYTFPSPAPAAGVIINDYTTPNGDGALARYWNSSLATINTYSTAYPATAAVITRVESVINNFWATGVSPGAGVSDDYFVSRYTADVLPEFSQVYTFTGTLNTAGRLTVNGKIVFDNWGGSSSTLTGTIDLQAGTRYPIVFEHMERTGDAQATLSWSSANLALEVIPQNRLFSNAPPQILSALDLFYIKNAPASPYQIVASGSPTGYSAANLPTGWSLNTLTGAIAVSTATAGVWDSVISATNANGTGSAILHVKIVAAGGAITRDEWSPVAGTAVSDIPLTTNPTSTGTVALLEGLQNAADNYGARIRGYITAPATGVYKFFLTASNAAELYISDDDEVVNSFKRAEVTAATNYRDWTNANAGKSPLLQLTAGHRYFVEVRHKAGVGSDHVSVGWMQPGEGGNDPGAYVPVSGTNVVVPGYVLSPYVEPAPVAGESTLYVTNMSAQGTALTTGYGSATLTLSADEKQAVLKYNYAGLTSSVTNQHIHTDNYPPPNNIIFDIDAAPKNADGSYTWDIIPTGIFTYADIVAAIKGGAAYINIHSANYSSGEIRGNFRLAAASQTFTPPAPLTWTDPESAASVDSHLNRNGAARFLAQATFGVSGTDAAPADGNPDDIAAVQSLGFEVWIDSQVAQATTYHYPFVFANRNQTSGMNSPYFSSLLFNSWWKNSVQAPDQLRQRLAFALSEILVTSDAGPLNGQADALSDYYDMLLAGTFGNFKDLLIATTLHPAMGRYLDMLGNDKPSLATGKIPNENYAREIQQLFSIGLNRLHPDGSLILNSKGELVPTYDQNGIIGFAHVFTGWYYYSAQVNPYPTSFSASTNWLQPMTPVPAHHFTGQKRILNNVVLPGLAMLGGQVLDPYATHTTTQINDPAYQALAAVELNSSHDQLFQHPNTPPFICRQLIQRFVTGTPSRGYLYRVVQKFNDDGTAQHVRGNMQAVIKAILLDYDARSSTAATAQGFGKQREPVSRVTAIARAFPAPQPVTGTYSQLGSRIDVTTSAPHLYTGTPSVVLDFDPAAAGDAGQPPDATYSVISTPTVTTTTFSVRSKSFLGNVPYTQANGITTFNNGTSTDFSFSAGQSIYAEYLSGAPAVPASGADTVEYRSSDTYTVIIANPTTKRGTYSQSANSATMTVTITAHGYTAASTIHLEAVSGSPLPAVATYTIGTITANTFTVTTADTPTAARSGTIFATPPADLVASTTGTVNLCYAVDFANRAGPMSVAYSDWNMDTTNTDLNQTPMQSPTVFNFFLPDYQYPGLLGNAGLVTPEFQLTSETSVIRQANTLYNGIFNDALSQLGLASFKSGARDIMVDLRPWMGTGPGGLPWAHNNNLDALIDELNTRLMAGKLSSTGTNNYASNPRLIVNAKQAIKDYILTLPYTRAVTNTAATALASVTVANHGLTTGTSITIANVGGTGFTPSINGTFTITVTGTNTFTVPVTCTNATPTLTTATATPSGGSAMPITALSGYTTVTVSSHGLVAGQSVTISGVTGGTFSPSINGTFTIQSVLSSSTFVVPVTRGSGGTYTTAVATPPNGFTDLVRDRIRSVVHLLVTSPDFTIQK